MWCKNGGAASPGIQGHRKEPKEVWYPVRVLWGRSIRSAHQHLASLLAQRFHLDQQALTVVSRRPRILRGVRLDELALLDLAEACEENGFLAFCEPANRLTTKVGTMNDLPPVSCAGDELHGGR